jgi:hypothetical protein
MTENCKANISNGEVTLPHELGHVIGLHHRGSGTPTGEGSRDGVNHLAGPFKDKGHPWNENLMSYGNDRQAQDIDVLQLKVIRKHPLLKDTVPPLFVPPKAKKPVPASMTPTSDDVILMQKYLKGVLTGLANTGYDLGNYGPAGDGVDGDYGNKTKDAVRAFQGDHGNGLVVDGIYGSNTMAAFDKELNG